MPENIPPAEHIKQVEKRLKESTPKLELEERDAQGLAGDDFHAEPETGEPHE